MNSLASGGEQNTPSNFNAFSNFVHKLNEDEIETRLEQVRQESEIWLREMCRKGTSQC